jgi:hypothetical protein
MVRLSVIATPLAIERRDGTGGEAMDRRAIIESHAGERIALIAASHLRLTGRELVPADGDIAEAMWNLPAVVLAHGTESDPLFFYGNRAALSLFEVAAEDFIRMPSRLSAEPLRREERARLLASVAQNGFTEDYSGTRVSATGQRFRIDRATVTDRAEAIHGQAATFDSWIEVD